MDARVVIAGIGRTSLGKRGELNASPYALMQKAVENALKDAGLKKENLDGLIVCPALAELRFMPSVWLAAQMGISHRLLHCSSLDAGGASPVNALLEAARLVKTGAAHRVAVVAGDAIASLSTPELLRRAGESISDPCYSDYTIPVIPTLYDLVAQWHMRTYGTTREQLAMVSVLMARQAARHPGAMNKTMYSLQDVLGSPAIAVVTNRNECARPADGAGAVIVQSGAWGHPAGKKLVTIVGGGEGVGFSYPPSEISEDMFSAGRAAKRAFSKCGLSAGDIGWWGIYDCFPICFLKFLEEVGLALIGRGGELIERWYDQTADLSYAPDLFPVNTHGGLLSFGAPWEAPAMFSIIEAIEQIRGEAGARQVTNPSPALIYGNGGIFSSSGVVILRETAKEKDYE